MKKKGKKFPDGKGRVFCASCKTELTKKTPKCGCAFGKESIKLSGNTYGSSIGESWWGDILIGVTGWLDEFRISKIARWTANFTIPTNPTTTLPPPTLSIIIRVVCGLDKWIHVALVKHKKKQSLYLNGCGTKMEYHFNIPFKMKEWTIDFWVRFDKKMDKEIREWSRAAQVTLYNGLQ